MRRVALAVTLLAGCQPGSGGAAGSDTDETGDDGLAWYAGSLRQLPVLTGELPAFVDALPHPEAGGYVAFTPDRSAAFDAFMAAIDSTLAVALEDPDAADFCALAGAAGAAGYAVSRFHDTARERWYLYARDDTGQGHAHLFVDAAPRRDLVIEAPHDPADAGTGEEGARVFARLGARVLLVNGDHRCSSTTLTTCSGSTDQCGGWYRESDVAHHLENGFHRAHVWLSDNRPDARFAQLHGMTGSATELANVGDGTFTPQNLDSVANDLVAALGVLGPDPTHIFSCQGGDPPPSGLCGSTNVQGRHTNEPGGMACSDSTSISSGRFLHIEQHKTLRDDDEGDGWSWRDVSDALADTWPECMGSCAAPGPQPGPDELPDLGCG